MGTEGPAFMSLVLVRVRPWNKDDHPQKKLLKTLKVFPGLIHKEHKILLSTEVSVNGHQRMDKFFLMISQASDVGQTARGRTVLGLDIEPGMLGTFPFLQLALWTFLSSLLLLAGALFTTKSAMKLSLFLHFSSEVLVFVLLLSIPQ